MKITGTGSAIPALKISNEELTKYMDTSDEWISTRTGIKERRLISTEHLEDLAAQAALNAIENAGIKATDLDYLICSNVVNEYITPGLGCIVQGKIGASCPCIDINGACAGFMYALDMAEALFNANKVKKVLIVCAEEPTRMIDWNNRNTAVLFGDGAGAVVLSEGEGFLGTQLTTRCNVEPLSEYRKLNESPFVKKEEPTYYLKMDGKEVFKIAVNASSNDINTLLERKHINSSEVDHYLLHQANIRIIDSICRMLKQDKKKFHHNIERTGNTSSASIPILLDELNREGSLKDGDTILMSAFGAGFSTGACLMKWQKQ